ncbi:hypothetical protein QKU48_gp0240 [Fadolivirus algeromassiliense]|jgi:hypothetical protein|uniref:Uncharacterized protein n=1 Tax=Fadolivirus FV1/VV64 TaxID=3070911 RepID=A0A7D3R1C2_9VIRU|nr:hypothetical protein QKU48_gp0240 [Fadolivirus algeromassiliense]QKF93698.1 hypothetical protein Fadolivirus_1_240 [Fadolivirus FV1/VV64]
MNNKKYIFKDLKTITNLRNYGNIIWNNDLEIDKRFKISDYLSYVKSTDIYKSFNDKLNIDFDTYTNFRIMGVCNLYNQLKLTITDISEYIYIITDQIYKTLYISIGRCHPIFWYKCTNKKSYIDTFDNIFESYNVNDYTLDHKMNIKGFIGNEDILSLNIHDLENHLILNKYSDKLIWGSFWLDHPFREEYLTKSVSYTDSIIYTGQSMRQEENKYTVSVRTLYSKSLITIHCYNDAYVVELRYNPINTHHIVTINEIFGRSYNIDMPIDVVITLINFPFVTYNDILNMIPFNQFHMYIITLLTDMNKSNDTTIQKLDEIINNLDKDDELVIEVKHYINQLENYKLLKQIIDENNFNDVIENIDNLNDTTISKIINDLMNKYNCIDNDFIKRKLYEYLNNVDV